MVSLCSRLAGLGLVGALMGGLMVSLSGVARGGEAAEPAEAAGAVVNRWLAGQATITNWSAGFVQTRTLKTLTQPLTARGQVWFRAPNRFRWEIGDPAQTIAVRRSNEVLVIYPLLKRAERYPIDLAAPGPWKHMLTLLEAGFPGSRTELEAKFRVVSEGRTNGLVELVLEPRVTAVRRMMPRFRISLADEGLVVRGTEMVFADGSSLRNAFTNTVVNGAVDGRLFEPEPGPEIRITEPMGRAGK